MMDILMDRRRANRMIAAIAAALLSLMAVGALAEATSGTHSVSIATKRAPSTGGTGNGGG